MQKEAYKNEKESCINLFDSDGKPKTKATVLIEIGSQYELFRDPLGDGYATILINGHEETWPINSSFFKNLLADQYYMLAESGVSRNIIGDAIDTLRGQARVRGEQHEVHRRTASNDGKIYIDLCDADWRVVEITKDGWQVLKTSPVKFLRSANNASLPLPEEGGSLDDLWSLMNISVEDRALVFGFLVRSLQSQPPFFVICIVGEQGTGKSFITELLRRLCDPSTSATSSPPKDDRDFFAGAINNWCIAYDNMSGVQPWLSDSLCRVLTGSSFSCRTLYTTTEETSIALARPVILNGIDDLASRPDLADRAIVLNLQPIKPQDFETTDNLWAKYDSIKGGLFGVLLSGISSALRTVSETEVAYRSRMLSATKWAAAAEAGAAAGGFIDAYARNQREMVIISLESSPFIAALLDMITIKKEWEGTPVDLQDLLPQYARDEEAVKSKAWPKSPVWVSRFIRRHAPALRKIGMVVELSRDSTERHIHLEMTVNPKKLVTPSQENIDDHTCKDQDFTVTTVMDHVQGRKNNVTTVTDDSNDSNDSKKATMSVTKNEPVQVELF